MSTAFLLRFDNFTLGEMDQIANESLLGSKLLSFFIGDLFD